MEPGDRLVYYASVWRRVFAVVEVIEPPDDEHPWRRTAPLAVVGGGRAAARVPRLEAAPPVEAIGVPARSMSQQSHIRLSPEHYARAVEVIASIAR